MLAAAAAAMSLIVYPGTEKLTKLAHCPVAGRAASVPVRTGMKRGNVCPEVVRHGAFRRCFAFYGGEGDIRRRSMRKTHAPPRSPSPPPSPFRSRNTRCTLRRGGPITPGPHSPTGAPNHGIGNGGGAGLGKPNGGGKLGGNGGARGDGDDSGRRDSAAAGAAASRDDFSARGNSVRHDYFGGERGDEEQRSLLGEGGGRSRGCGDGGAPGGDERDVFAMIPGSTMSMFLEVGGWEGGWVGGWRIRKAKEREALQNGGRRCPRASHVLG